MTEREVDLIHEHAISVALKVARFGVGGLSADDLRKSLNELKSELKSDLGK